jgi:SET domain-containing protein
VINCGSRSHTDQNPQSIIRGRSPIAGQGLFATTDIAAGTALPDVDLDLVNHSCDPNLGWSDAALGTLRVVAAGEELTVDYATFLTDPSFAMFCHCETYRCRQVVEGTDWQIPQLQRRYAGHWAPHVRELIDRPR